MEFTGIENKVALITGASGTIGSNTAEQFARLGAKLALTGRDGDKLQKVAEACRAAGATQVFTVVGDITDQDSVKNIIDSTVNNFHGIDILINCAGIIRPGVFLTTSMANYDAIFNTNLKGTFSVCKLAMPHLVASKGNIINVSSFTGIRPAYAYFAYAMAEACLDQFTRALALELGPKGVRVNSVNPGVVKDSSFWTREGAPMAKNTPDQMEKLQEGIKKMYPLRRIAEVKDVTSAIVFLSSDQSSFVHGVVLPVDGGKVLTAKSALDDKPQS